MKNDLVTDIWPHAAALEQLRKRAGNLSVERAAGMVGATRSSWHAWEAGTRRPSHESLKAIVEAFECPPALVGYEPPRGWELVPADWIIEAQAAMREDQRRMHDETRAALDTLLNALRAIDR